jgi:hypothetical protein
MPIDYRGPGAARHAAPLMFAPASVGHHTRRALRLFAIAGIWVAGLCLVVASTALVAAESAPHRANMAAAATTVRTAAPRRASDQPLATFHGHGNAVTRSFWIAARSQWELHWSYSCPAGGHFLVEAGSGAAGSKARGPRVDVSGVSGNGVTSLNPDGQRHDLIVRSACSWTITVMQP